MIGTRSDREEFGNLKSLRRWLSFLFVLLVASACTDETPIEVGDDLLPSGDVRTFEVILDLAEFATYDTTFSGYALPQNAAFTVLANKFEGVLDANTLLRFQQPPPFINVRNPAGSIVVDSAPRYFAGRLVLRVDTLSSESGPPLLVRGFRTAEAWHTSATWDLRIDTGVVKLPWATRGGTRGAQFDTATWAAGDSIVLDVDSQTVAQWIDTTNAARGALIVAETPNTRVRVNSAVLRLSARSVIRPDTVVNLDVSAGTSTFIFNPQPPAPTELRVGGVPTWRTIIGIRQDLADLTFPCPGVSNCQVRLDRAHINRAELLLQPVRTPAGFILEDTTFTQVRTLSPSPGVPLERSPIGVDVCNLAARCILSGRTFPQMFGNPPATAPIALDVSNYIFSLVDQSILDTNRPPFALVLLAPSEPNTFGFATFAQGPRLRLVLTAPVERAQ